MLGIIIDVAIGVLFIYLLLSLLCSGIVEFILTILGVRASNLKRIIENNLGINSDIFFNQPPIKSLKPPLSMPKRRIKKIFKIKFEPKPTYIPTENFVQAIENMILSGFFDNNFKETLKSLIEGSGKHRTYIFSKIESKELKEKKFENTLAYLLYKSSNIEEFRHDLGKLYENIRARAQGWYKRKAQCWLFAVGLFLAVFLNIDIINITKTLYANHILRDAIVEQAKIYWNQTTPEQSENSTDFNTKSNKRELISELDSCLNIMPIGWNKKLFSTIIKSPLLLFEKILGFLLTAIGISFGAPFWFDLLGKLINLRSAGPKPEELKKVK